MKKQLTREAIVILCMSIALLYMGCGTKKNSNDSTYKSTESVIDNEEKITNESSMELNLVDENKAADEEARLKAEEEKKAAEEEARLKAEEEKKAAEEEARLKAEEEKKAAEEEARLKAEEEKKAAEEEARLKAEEVKKTEEERIRNEQMNSFSMLYYLAITAEEIRTSRENRLILEDIYTSLLNDINPGAIDEITQDHLKNLRDLIKQYINISTKRERLQFIYNQNKATAIRSAVPNPLAILSVTNSFDWKKLAVSVAYTAVDSYNNYKKSSEGAENAFIMSGWELDDEEEETIRKNRDRVFDYMVDIVQKYNLDGLLTLNEKAIEDFAKICDIESIPERIKRLEAEERTYKLLGNYWLELANCYFETDKYRQCLDCVEKYNELSTGIYRKDFNYVKILPKAIASAEAIYSGNKYITVMKGYADDIIKNTSTTDWAVRYYAAQTYLSLYSKTKSKEYLETAYGIIFDNVTVLLSEQRKLNSIFLNDVVEVTISEPDYRYLSDKEKKEKMDEYKTEKKLAQEYNKNQKEIRETELPQLYEPLILNCELLFALADEMELSAEEKNNIEAILQTNSNGIFISRPINDAYSFSKKNKFFYNAEISKDEIRIPANLLTSESRISIMISEGGSWIVFDDASVSKVERKGSTIDAFTAVVTSSKWKNYKWTANSKITIRITYTDACDKSIDLDYEVMTFQSHWLGDIVGFGRR